MDSYSVPEETNKVFWDGLINNPLHTTAPAEVRDAAKYIEFAGGDTPELPFNWRFAESVAALKGFQGAMLNVLLKKKYGVNYQRIIVDTDHASLYIFSIFLPTIDPFGPEPIRGPTPAFFKYFPNGDKHDAWGTNKLKAACTNIYKTKDNRFYHIHASMNPAICQKALGLDPTADAPSFEEGCKVFQDKIIEYPAEDIELKLNEEYRQAGTVCRTIEEYRASEHGKANAHIGLYEVHRVLNPAQVPGWWTPVEGEGQTSASRPLFGLKVIDLTRIIAAPTIARELAEMGASVLRITSPNVTDMTVLNADLGWGKWNAHLDLTKEEDRERLRVLILEADVVIDGYRPGVMEKLGFGKDDILRFFESKDRGVVYVRENCYGWYGPWKHRSGWQQITDANVGVSWEFGRAMGLDEPVTPPFPNSDYCAGLAGAIGVLQALVEKADKGGSFVVDTALNYYSQWLVNSVSTYPPVVWDDLWTRYDRFVIRHTENFTTTIPKMMGMLMRKQSRLLRPDTSFFEIRDNKAIGVPFRTVKPILQFPDGLVKLGYNVGSRGNGVDRPMWPDDLTTEVLF